MPAAPCKDRFWSRLVWPLLWPFLLAQLLLVLLCLAVGLFLWLSTPEPTSWADAGWLLLMLLVGTTLTTAAFLLQLRHRLSDFQAGVDDGLARLERRLAGLAGTLPAWLPAPGVPPSEGELPAERLGRLDQTLGQLQARWRQAPDLAGLLLTASRPALLLFEQRSVAANLAMEQLLGESAEALRGEAPETRLRASSSVSGEPAMMQVRDAEGRWRRLAVERLAAQGYELLLFDDPEGRQPQLGGLLAARERAREDSRLKSRYLGLLQRELAPLLGDLTAELERAAPGVDDRRLAELRERMADVTLLLNSLAGDRDGLPDPDTPSLPDQGASLRVLVVDDGPVNRMLASQVLEGQGVMVDSVAGGQEALERRRRHAYDLVFMDIFMPDIDGVETARRWREAEAADPGSGRSVLVALTANATESDRRRFHEAGMDDYLAKPYRPRALIELLRHWRPDAFEETAAT